MEDTKETQHYWCTYKLKDFGHTFLFITQTLSPIDNDSQTKNQFSLTESQGVQTIFKDSPMSSSRRPKQSEFSGVFGGSLSQKFRQGNF